MPISRATALAALALMLACKGTPGPLTPEQAAVSSQPGARVTLQGTVFGTTFDSGGPGGGYALSPDRYTLLRTKIPQGVGQSDPQGLSDDIVRGFGFGLHVPLDAAYQPARPLPHIGDVVRATGTFRRASWNGHTVPMLDDLTELQVISGTPPLLEQGASCAVDMECREHLVCERASRTCLPTPTRITWGSGWHDVNGACDADADCPTGQVCELHYAMPAQGQFSPSHATGDAGRHLCVPAPDATMASLCPRIAEAADLSGGRFAQGKEICVRGKLLLAVLAEDRDTHTQLYIEEPLPYPLADAPYAVFGATTENSPSYKDPARPQGALATPPAKRDVVYLGTVRYDEGHGWFELHPIKAYWVVAAQ